MKYLKTKYGIIDVSEYELVQETQHDYIFRKAKGSKKRHKDKLFLKDMVVATADDPKELCDEFMVEKYTPTYNEIYIAQHDDKKIIEQFEEEHTEIYGCIYVQKGKGKGHKLEPVCKLENGSFVVLKD